jgi:hypothetical protein
VRLASFLNPLVLLHEPLLISRLSSFLDHVEEIVIHANKEQEKDRTKFIDKSTGLEMENAQEPQALLEWFTDKYKDFGAALEFVTNRSQEGSQFQKGFSGIGGLLRFVLPDLYSNLVTPERPLLTTSSGGYSRSGTRSTSCSSSHSRDPTTRTSFTTPSIAATLTSEGRTTSPSMDARRLGKRAEGRRLSQASSPPLSPASRLLPFRASVDCLLAFNVSFPFNLSSLSLFIFFRSSALICFVI